MEISVALRDISDILGISRQGAGKIVRGSDPLQSEIKGNKRFLSSKLAREVFEARGFKYPKKNIIFHTLKGGAGKTELSRNTAYRAAALGARVLLVDFDKQANASRSLGVDNPEFVMVDVITKRCKIGDTVIKLGENLDLIPSSFKNARLELEVINKPGNQRTFYKNIFSSIRDNYDFVIFDMPPDLNTNSYLASLWANTVLILINPDRFSLDGAIMTIQSLDGLKESFPDLLQDRLVVLNKFDNRERSSFKIIAEAQELKNVTVLPCVIRSDANFKNAHSDAKVIFEMPRSSTAKEDIDLLTQELLGMRDFFSDGKEGNA